MEQGSTAVHTGIAQQAALEHVLKHHADADGWITLARKEGDKWIQHHYRAEEIGDALAEWLGEDIYFSQQTFYKPYRQVENIRQLRSIYADVDCHLIGYDVEWTVESIMSNLVDSGKLPEPNVVVHSGRGLYLIWWLAPAPAWAVPLWQAVEDYFVNQLKSWGGDCKATDAARVLRVAGTVNSKSNTVVTVLPRHSHRYELRDLQREYLPELTPRKKGDRKPSRKVQIDRRLFNERTLYWSRLQDLMQLCELRKWDMRGSREFVCFLYRYWKCHFLADTERALEETLEFNRQFIEPLSEKEVRVATRSAETAFKSQDKEYRYRNDTLIERLAITSDEQMQLSTIISDTEKKRRHRQTEQKRRRSRGAIDRDTYLSEAAERHQQVLQMREQGYSYRAIGNKLGMSQTQVMRIVKNPEIRCNMSVRLY